MAMDEPRLLAHLTDLDTLRMHVIVFYLAHRGIDADDSQDAAFLASARSRDILARAIGRPPGRLQAVLRRLPDSVLERKTYRRLATLMSNDRVVNLLMKRTSFDVDFLTLVRLAAVPQALLDGPLLRAIGDNTEKLVSIAETAAWLARRWNIDAIDRFAAVRTLPELHRLTSDFLRSLPPVPRLPPRSVGYAKLIETARELRRAGRLGRNCLGQYVDELASCSTAFYVWDDGDEPVYIRLDRSNGLGWFLSDMKLAKNRTLPEERRQIIDQAFEAAGFDWGIVATNLVDLMRGIPDEDEQ